MITETIIPEMQRLFRIAYANDPNNLQKAIVAMKPLSITKLYSIKVLTIELKMPLGEAIHTVDESDAWRI